MIRLSFIFGLSLICMFYTGYSQINQADIPDAKVYPPSEYGGKSLWGYINGGADLYLEYGFSKLLVQEIELNGVLLKANIYEMTSDKAAYGIFSVNVHKCKKRNILKEFDCQGPYQYQVFAGKYYISVVSETGKPEAEKLSIDVGKAFLSKIPEKKFKYPDIYNSVLLKENPGKLKFFKGELGLQNGYPEWSDYFTGLKNYEVWILQLSDIDIAFIAFEKDEDAELFLTRSNNDGELTNWKRNNNELVIYKSSSKQYR